MSNDGWKLVNEIDQMIEDDIADLIERREHAIGPMEESDIINVQAYAESVLGRIKILLRNHLADLSHDMRQKVAYGKAKAEIYGSDDAN